MSLKTEIERSQPLDGPTPELFSVFLSVVIPTHHRASSIGNCLERLANGAQTLEQGHYEVIVSDDGDNADTQNLIAEKFPWVRWVKSEEKGPANNRNNGAAHARGDWLVFIDDDCIAESGFLEAIYIEAKKEQIEVVEGRIVCPDERDHPLFICPDNSGGGVFWTANLSVRTETFRALQGFDKDLAYFAEDMEFGSRIKKNGIRHRFLDTARVAHPAQKFTIAEFWRRFWSQRAMYLYAHKLGVSPNLGTNSILVVVYVIKSHTLNIARNLKQLLCRKDRQWKKKATMVSLQILLWPVMIPYLIYWEFRFRRQLSATQGL